MRVGDIKELHEKKFRKESGFYMIQGEKIVDEAIGAGIIVELFCIEELASKYKKIHTSVHIASRKAMQDAGTQSTNDGVIALARCSYDGMSPHDVTLVINTAAQNVVVALDGVNDPGNLGTIIRTADWFGITDIICNIGTVDVYNPKVIAATMGSFLRVRVHYVDIQEFLKQAKASAIQIITAEMHGESLYDSKLDRTGILVMGSESHGVQDEVRSIATKTITIPKEGGAESLNVGIATAIILSHMRVK